MNILIVSNEYLRGNRIGNPIVDRIVDALNRNDQVASALFSPFSIRFSAIRDIRRAAKRVDIIHVQFGGLYAVLVWLSVLGINKPKILTFHGTDIHGKEIKTTKSLLIKVKIWLNQKASFLSLSLYDRLGFVSKELIDYLPIKLRARYSSKFFFQPLGVDYSLFQSMSVEDACLRLNLSYKKYVLFSDKTGTKLKRRDIAEQIVSLLGDEYELLVMSGVNPSTVPLYINASEFILLTSDEEGSPNIVREALSLNRRVYSVDVGDVKNQLSGLKNSAIISRKPEMAVKTIRQNLDEPYVDNTRELLYDKNSLERTTAALVNIYVQSLSVQ